MSALAECSTDSTCVRRRLGRGIAADVAPDAGARATPAAAGFEPSAYTAGSTGVVAAAGNPAAGTLTAPAAAPEPDAGTFTAPAEAPEPDAGCDATCVFLSVSGLETK